MPPAEPAANWATTASICGPPAHLIKEIQRQHQAMVLLTRRLRDRGETPAVRTQVEATDLTHVQRHAVSPRSCRLGLKAPVVDRPCCRHDPTVQVAKQYSRSNL